LAEGGESVSFVHNATVTAKQHTKSLSGIREYIRHKSYLVIVLANTR